MEENDKNGGKIRTFALKLNNKFNIKWYKLNNNFTLKRLENLRTNEMKIIHSTGIGNRIEL